MIHLYKKYLALLLSFLICVFFLVRIISPASTKTSDEVKSPAAKKIDTALPLEEEFPHIIKRNVPLYAHLTELGVPPIDVIDMVKAAKPLKNLSRLSTNVRFQIIQNEELNLVEAKFRFSPVEKLNLKKTDEKWTGVIINEPINIKHLSFKGEVNSSLWESAIEAKMDPQLIIVMSEIFGWEVDFNREVRSGDKWRITVEEKLVKGQHVGWGSTLAAEYINAGETHTAVLFRHNDENIGYYTLKGESLRKMFLKSPLRFGRVTSKFNRRRFHPKLKIIRPHNGVDYGAPIGTPVRSVADGVVTFSRRSGGGGNVLKIRHNSTYKTAYKHLSRYGKGVRRGTKVKQGQIVAYVGNTGLSTGPHLHYEFFVNGRFVDPLKQKFPSADPIAKKYKDSFFSQSIEMVKTLPDWPKESTILLPNKKEAL